MGNKQLVAQRAGEFVDTRRRATRAAVLLRSALRSALRRDLITQRDLAAALRVTPQYLNDVIRGRRDVSLKLAKAVLTWSSE